MYFNSFGELLAMGGYASYVWSSFAITILPMAMLWLASAYKGHLILKQVRANLARQERIEAAKQMERTL
jgi:heme exporter protein D